MVDMDHVPDHVPLNRTTNSNRHHNHGIDSKLCCCPVWKNRLKTNHTGTYRTFHRGISISYGQMLYWTIWTLLLLVKHGTCFTNQTFFVEENTQNDTLVGIINIAGTSIKYSPPTVPNFLLGTSDGTIRVVGSLDRETKASYKFYAVRGQDYAEVNIVITDVNDNSPEFHLRPNVTSLTISEAAAPNYKTALGSVVDRDIGNNSTQGCEIIEGNIDGTFLLETSRQQGGLVLDLVVNNYELDFEMTPFYSIVLKAFDGGTPQRTSTVRINITVQDINDNSPMFAHSHYSAWVPEDAPVGHVVMQVQATDVDSGSNGKVRYEIDYGYSDSQDTFQVNATSGVIYVNRELDYEGDHKLYKVVIKARDQGEHVLEDTTTVTINVTDINDNPPKIDIYFLDSDEGESSMTGHVMENEPPGGAYLARISVSDDDISSPTVNVTLHGGEDYFGLVTRDNTVYLISLDSELDREITPFFNMRVTAVDSGTPPLQSEETFKIIVDDVNDNDPHFQQSTYYADIQEVVPPESSVIQLSASDPDDGDNSLVTYSILNTPQTNSDWFQIDPRSGLITTKTRVDCETQSEPRLVIVATDSGDPPLSGTTTVIIRIRDVNDNQPIFDQSFYNVSVLENMANGSCVLTVSAIDPDCGGPGARVQYSIPNNLGFPVPTELYIKPHTGQICIKQPLDYEHKHLFEFPIMASDKDGLDATTMVKVNIRDVNDNAPVFKQMAYSLNLVRDTEPHTVIVNVEAVDKDSSNYGRVTYQIISGNNEALFTVGASSGIVRLEHGLPPSTSQYSLVIEATDGGGLTSYTNTVVRISITDPSSRQPEFSQSFYLFSVAEDADRMTLVGVVEATTSEGSVIYSIVSGEMTGYFTIHPTTGEIHTDRGLDHDVDPDVILSIQAAAGNPPTYAQAQVKVEISDVNDNAPEFSVSGSSIEISVKEDTAPGTGVYKAIATDRDSGANSDIMYQLQDLTGRFSIVPSDGQIKLLRPLDHETQTQHQLIVMAKDHGSPQRSAELTIFINVQDVNDNPPVFQQRVYTFRVSEHEPVNHEFGQLSATDDDSGNNGKVTYLIQNSDNYEMFGIYPDSGVLYNKIKLDREEVASHDLQIVAVDNGIPANSATAQVHIYVLDSNDNSPQFIGTPYLFSVEENRPPHTGVGFVMATDQDNTDDLLYSIQPRNQHFRIDANSGEIITSKQLDRESKDTHTVTVVVSDQGSPPITSSVLVTIHVLDMNDNSPVFSRNGHYTDRIKEKRPKGTPVTSVLASDKDRAANGSVTYSLVRDENKLDWQMFQVHPTSGRVTTNDVLDHEARPQYVFKVLAHDGGSPSRTSLATVEITVDDENEEPPVFIKSFESFVVVENTAPGKIIDSVKAKDADTGPNVKVYYYIVSGNLYNTFGVNKTTGDIYIARPVDYEECSEYSMQIMAVDNDPLNPLSSVVSVNISITDVNDNAPTFEYNPVLEDVSENIEPNSHIITLTAIDLDSGPRGVVKYSIESQSPDAEWVTIDANTGFIYTKAEFDYEATTEISVVVKAMDQPTGEAAQFSTISVRILVEDENDNVPVFQSQTEVALMEDEPIGYPVIHVIATDRDSHQNGNVSYVIETGNEAGNLWLDPFTGLLSIAKMLDRETTPVYHLHIKASDMGHPRHTSYTNLTVTLVDVNDNPPRFQQSIYEVDILEGNDPNILVTQVTAIDSDEGVNAQLVYIIPTGTFDGVFNIDSDSGEIFCQVQLDREQQSSWTITVYVKDSAFPSLYDTATVIITVLDKNDNTPLFYEQTYQMAVPENAHSIIHTVKATDPDLDLNGLITYSIIEGDPENKFTLNAMTGQLSCEPLDREVNSLYSLTIKAEDNGPKPQLYSLTTALITVLDVNDNDPQFIDMPYTESIPENTVPETSVLTVQATDKDEGVNSLISYSINNSAQGLFKIDNATGLITTAGEFDREKKASYIFEVYAIDGGLYGPRSRSIRVDVTITDINDNSPVFKEVPYKAEIGQNFPVNNTVTIMMAEDIDAGSNGTVRYSLATSNMYFKIDATSGEVRTKRWLTDADAIRVHMLEVYATDQGSAGSRQSVGYVEIKVGNVVQTGSLRFTNLTYQVTLMEHVASGTPVTTVTARLSSGASTDVTYTFASGNEQEAFHINHNTGQISVNDPSQLDYETQHRMRLIVVATSNVADGGYVAVWVNLEDTNDNYPHFTQDRYTSSVWEGNPRQTYVTQVIATDLDEGLNGQIDYVITGGNKHSPFAINPSNTGIVTTNAILDREINSTFKLTIEARDQGTPPKTSTCILKIQVVDENDNEPFFPTYPPKERSEGDEPGTEVIKVTANDPDLNPVLTYSFEPKIGNPEGMFSIDTYSGRIIWAKKPDYEQQTKYTLTIVASDTKSNVTREVIVLVKDENDNAPLFPHASYEVNVPESTLPHVPVITVNATDADHGDNAMITYTMLPAEGFYINSSTGTIYTNTTIKYTSSQPITLVVTATDHGVPALLTVVPVVVRVMDINDNAPQFTPIIDLLELDEDREKGQMVLKLSATDADDLSDNKKIDYSITGGNSEAMFDISQSSGDLLLVGNLDYERTTGYVLTVMARDRGEPPLSSTITVNIAVQDVNDNPPVFDLGEVTSSINESAALQSSVTQVFAHDDDSGHNGRVAYQIMSGNDYNNFEINRDTGLITVKTQLDHESADIQKLIIKAVDSSDVLPQSAFCTVTINVTDVNEYPPDFPQYMYLEEVMEMKEAGSAVFQAQANDKDGGWYGRLTYSLHGADSQFEINAKTGEVKTKMMLNYTTETQYQFNVIARDNGGYQAQVQAIVVVLPLVMPQFKETSYQFDVPGNAKAGDHIGRVQADDTTGKPSTLIRYTLKAPSEYFVINITTGDIFVYKDLQSGDDTRRRREVTLHRHRRALESDNITLIVVASGGNPKVFPTAETVVHVQVDRSCDGCQINATSSGRLSTTALALIVAFVIVAVVLGIVILVMCLRGRDLKGHLQSPSHYDSSSFETLDVPPPPMRGNFAPPPYKEANTYPHLHQHNMTTSEISDQSHSASSGRGSAEGDEVDEEIRQITDAQLTSNILRMPDSGIQQDDDAVSEHSVHNHQEYLLRLGIDTSKFKINSSEPTTTKSGMTTSVESMHQFSDEGGGEGDGMDIGNLVYSKLNEVKANEDLATMDGTKQFGYDNDKSNGGSLASVINSEEEFSGSYNWDYLLDWGPQYQPLAAVFTEIARLKDDAIKPKTKPTQIVPQRQGHGPLPHQVRMGGPPPIITDTPPKSIPLAPMGHGMLNSSQPSHSQTSLQSGSSKTNSARTSQLTNISLPKSPLSYESSFTSPAMSPSFTPSLSPLATRSPSISPLVTPKGIGHASSGYTTPLRQDHQGRLMVQPGSSESEQEIQI